MSIRANVDARRLDTMILFQRDMAVQDNTGDPRPANWQPLPGQAASGVHAASDAEMARELLARDGPLSVNTQTFWVRTDTVIRLGVLQSDRILWKGKQFEISAMPDQGRRGRLSAILATAGVVNRDG